MNILVYDISASESGALSILQDFYEQVLTYKDKTINWIFVVSTPILLETENIKVLRFPWVKRKYINRIIFECFYLQNIIKQYKIDRIFSLQNTIIPFTNKPQIVYIHNALPFSGKKFSFRENRKLWFYQNILVIKVNHALKKSKKIVVQTEWMKKACEEKFNINKDKIFVSYPHIDNSYIIKYVDNSENRKIFFYPATPFEYKNHITILKACYSLQKKGIKDYKVVFTFKGNESKNAKALYKYAKINNLNVDFRGNMLRQEVFNMYSKSVLVYPSYLESFGMPLLEARMSNSFIIASDCNFSREILDKYKNGYFFYPYSYQELADKMLYIINNAVYFESSETNLLERSNILLMQILSI